MATRYSGILTAVLKLEDFLGRLREDMSMSASWKVLFSPSSNNLFLFPTSSQVKNLQIAVKFKQCSSSASKCPLSNLQLGDVY